MTPALHHPAHGHAAEHHQLHGLGSHYVKLALNLGVSAVIMFVAMYAMLSRLEHLYLNLDTLYMTLLMVAPMGMLMLFTMRSMYTNRRLNLALYAALATIFVTSLLLSRTQGAIGNDQLLRGMIPHHSSAILMCDEAALTDPQVQRLCARIVKSQTEEIAEMKALLSRR